MGRPKRYRERVQFEMQSVSAKGIRGVIERTLHADFGRNQIEADVLAARSVEWLQALGVPAVPGQVRLSVPSTPSRRYARSLRRVVTVTAVDVGEDTDVWKTFGLAALQRRRLLRWLLEIHRQGGWASLTELAAWANLTPTALGARLRPVRKLGVWLPHIGGPAPDATALGLEAWLVDRYLGTGEVEKARALCGLTVSGWESVLRRFIATLERSEAGAAPEAIAVAVGRSVEEVRQFVIVARRHHRKRALKEIRRAYDGAGSTARHETMALEAELVAEYGFSRVSARLYHQWLRRFALELGTEPPPEGELIFFAINASEGARTQLAEARHVPVRLCYFTHEDAALGPHSDSPTRVAALKFARILRYATEARAQGALLTLPDLAVLMGIHVDAIRRQLAAHPGVVVPTRGRVKDIGRGVTHKAQIVELYLQMHTETEIVERTQHSYESIEAYLKDFARVVTLAGQGLNAVMIRRVTNRSMALVQAYLDLHRRYDQPAYHFRLAQLRQVFARDEVVRGEKRGPFRSPIGGVTP